MIKKNPQRGGCGFCEVEIYVGTPFAGEYWQISGGAVQREYPLPEERALMVQGLAVR